MPVLTLPVPLMASVAPAPTLMLPPVMLPLVMLPPLLTASVPALTVVAPV